MTRPPARDPARWARGEELFHEASELPPTEQEAFVERECAGDPELRDELTRLLAIDAMPEAAIDHPVEALAGPLLAADSEPEVAPGTVFGHYRILGVLGVGGMGTVYRAERADGAYDREVAIKVLRPGRLRGEAGIRFERERRILGRLRHPGIATLVDGGVTSSGQAYLVMELIEGSTITDYARRQRLDVDARVRLVISVAEAVHFAHGNLVVHRDIKPSNILVDEQGLPKLLDFGIARLLDAEEESVTRTGAVLLTPDYAAPEQISGGPITTAIDVYALGAVLHELLTGTRPFGRVDANWGDVQRVLHHDPPLLSQVEGLERATRVLVRGDLETVVRKALHKDPARRYHSASALAEDLRRYRAGRPIHARPDSVGYRMGRFVRRHRTASILAAALLLTLVLGLAGTLWQARAARLEAERGDAVGRFLISLFEAADPGRDPGRAITALDLLEAGFAKVDSLDAGPETRVDLLTTLGLLFSKLGHTDRAQELLHQAVGEARDALPSRDPALGMALNQLGVELSSQGDLDDAETVLREALAARRRDGAAAIDLASTEGNLALVLRRRGHHAAAESLYRRAIDRLAAVAEGDSALFTSELMGLGQVYQFMGRRSAAESLFRTVRRFEEDRDRPEPRLAIAIHNLGVVLADQERYDEATAAHQEALAVWQRLFPQGHPEIARSREAMARVLERQGRWTEADSLYREAIARWSVLYGDGTSHIATIRANQANLRYFAGDFAAAAEAYRDGIRIWRANDERVLLGAGLRNLGIIERERGDLASADTLLAAALTLRREINGELHTDVAETHTAIARLRNQQGRHAEAERHAREADRQFRQLLEPGHRLTQGAHLELGVALAAQERFDTAQGVLHPVYESFRRTRPETDPGRGRAALWLGITMAGRGDPVRARELLRDADRAFANLPPDSPDRRRAAREGARLPP